MITKIVETVVRYHKNAGIDEIKSAIRFAMDITETKSLTWTDADYNEILTEVLYRLA